MNILIAGDIFISDEFKGKNLIDKSIISLFENSDYRIVNLEAPITNDNSKDKIIKTGPHLRNFDTTIIPFLKLLKMDLVTLANNHILDYGVNGLMNTFKTLNNEKVFFVGAGNNLKDAAKHYTIENNEIKIAILNFCESEWSIAKEDEPGCNPLEIISNVNQIKRAKINHDKVICIIHGGHEHYELPSPNMVDQYHFYAENGADAIVGHHTHCIGGYETYKGVPIIYSLGNFIFTKKNKHTTWYNGLILNFKVSKENKIEFEIYPHSQDNENLSIKLLEGNSKQLVIDKLNTLNKIITNKELLLKYWNEFLLKKQEEYVSMFSPIFGIKYPRVRGLLYRLKIHKLLHSNTHLKLILNLIRCESHAEIVKHSIEKKINK